MHSSHGGFGNASGTGALTVARECGVQVSLNVDAYKANLI